MPRSIPACAGEPILRLLPPLAVWVYPRVCGGTGYPDCILDSDEGLSPRVRGNRVSSYLANSHLRSIPACAGEPERGNPMDAKVEVYPRVCGGTVSDAIQALNTRGLSPRVRGNPFSITVYITRHRSIPACAGEPIETVHKLDQARVYPRVCGGTRRNPATHQSWQGLSPRVRGNPSKSSCNREV